jgi:hypothetical protein
MRHKRVVFRHKTEPWGTGAHAIKSTGKWHRTSTAQLEMTQVELAQGRSSIVYHRVLRAEGTE